MYHHSIPLHKSNAFSSLLLDYVSKDIDFDEFIDFSPSIQGLKEAIDQWTFEDEKRELLVTSLQQQNRSTAVKVKENIALLAQKNTYTVTTGHQLNLATGPLYFIYKIVSTIKLAQKLKQEFPTKEFVPIYWMASEDHDFEEINHFHLFGQTHQWHTEQTGAVGAFHLKEVKESLKTLKEEIEILSVYNESKNLSDATRSLVDKLFEEKGLICLDANDAALKRSFLPVFKDELCKQNSFELVEEQSKKLSNKGYKKQVNPREINLFYMKDDIRERLIMEEGQIKVKNTSLKWSLEDALLLAEQHPERLSPNVILRPLYQQSILPNICYLGGGGELAYWFQLKQLFHFYEQKIPVLLPRNIATIIPKTLHKKIKQLAWTTEDLFAHTEVLKKKVMATNGTPTHLLGDESKAFEQLFETLKEKVGTTEKTLVPAVDGEKKKFIKWLQKLEHRLEKEEEKKYAQQLALVESIKSKLFPKDKLQERHDNFLTFYINHPSFIEDLFETFDPLTFEMNVLYLS